MNILVITDKPYPYGSAYSSRARHFVLAFHSMEANVTVVSANLDCSEAKALEIENVNYISMQYAQNRITQLGIGVASRYASCVKKLISENKYTAIFVNSITYALPHICKIAQGKGIPVFVEKCEWYDPSSFMFGKLNPYYREYIREIDSVRPDGYIVISPFFEEYYRRKGYRALLVPTILDIQNIDFSVHSVTTPIKIVFSGNLGKGKEIIKPIAEAIQKLGDEAAQFSFVFYGPTEEQLRENIRDDKLFSRVAPHITIAGKVPQKKVYSKLSGADYTIFLREQRKSSDAGFPTKLAESMAVGTPVIANSTGSVGKYLKNEINGFLLEDATGDQMVNVLKKVAAVKDEEYKQMRMMSRMTAEKWFDYEVYVQKIKAFIEGGKNGNGASEKR